MKGIDEKTMLMLVDAYDITADKIETWKNILSDEDTEEISNAITWLVRNQAKTPRVADVIAIIKGEEKPKQETRKEKWTEDELYSEILKANSKNMQVVVEKTKFGYDIIYWENENYLPKGAKKVYLQGVFFFKTIATDRNN